MSLLFIDSFDHYGTSDIGLKWSSIIGNSTLALIAPISGRRGGGALSLVSGGSVQKDLAGTRTVILGCAMRITQFSSSTDPSSGGAAFFMTMGNADGNHLTFFAASDGSIWVYRRISSGASASNWQLLGKTTGAVLQQNVYAYLEVKATIGATANGALKVLVNGVTVINVINVSTIGYLSTTETITHINLFSSGGTAYYDDLYICDANGATNNDFFGDVRIDVVRPSADGTYHDFVPDTGTAHFSRVNEMVADQLTYVAASTVGAKDSYQFDDLTAIVGTVRGVQIVDAATKDDAGVRSISHLVKSGVSEQFSAAMPLSTDRKFYTTVHETDPATGASWTQTGINAAEFGIVVAA